MHEFISVAAAAAELGITPDALRGAIKRGVIQPVRLDGRTNLIPRSALEEYRSTRLGRRGKYPRHEAGAPMGRPITLVLTNEEAAHVALALGLVIDPQAPLFHGRGRTLLARVRDRLLPPQTTD